MSLNTTPFDIQHSTFIISMFNITTLNIKTFPHKSDIQHFDPKPQSSIWPGGGRTNERPGIDHVTSGPMISLKKTAPDGANRQTDRHVTHGHSNSITESGQ